MAGKQAKLLNDAMVRAMLRHVRTNRHALRDSIIILLSVKAGLRAAEIAKLTWPMVLCHINNDITHLMHAMTAMTLHTIGTAFYIFKK